MQSFVTRLGKGRNIIRQFRSMRRSRKRRICPRVLRAPSWLASSSSSRRNGQRQSRGCQSGAEFTELAGLQFAAEQPRYRYQSQRQQNDVSDEQNHGNLGGLPISSGRHALNDSVITATPKPDTNVMIRLRHVFMSRQTRTPQTERIASIARVIKYARAAPEMSASISTR